VNTNLKNLLVWLAVVVSLVLLWQMFYNIRNANIEQKDFASFYQDMTAKKIRSVKITNEDLEGIDLSGKKFKTVIPAESSWDVVKALVDNEVAVKIEKSPNTSFMYVFLSSWMPVILLIGFGICLRLLLKKR
jgi:ATP-dependent Zn protease